MDTTARPSALSSLPEQHRAVLQWIVEFCASMHLDDIIQAIINKYTDLVLDTEELYQRIMFAAIIRSTKLGETSNMRDWPAILKRILPDKKIYRELIQQVKAHAIVGHLRGHLDLEGFGATMDMVLDEGDTHIREQMTKILEQLQKSTAYRANKTVTALLENYREEVLKQKILNLLQPLEEVLPVPFLERVYNEYKAGKYNPQKEKEVVSYPDLIDAYTQKEGTREEFQNIVFETDSSITKFKSKNKPQTVLQQKSQQLKAIGKDPLDDALKSSKSRRHSTSEFHDETGPAKKPKVLSKPIKPITVTPEKEGEQLQWSEEDGHRSIHLDTPKAKKPVPLVIDVQEAKPQKTQQRRFWSEEEVTNLLRGVARLGQGSWKQILEEYEFSDRRTVDLKDKWRNLIKKDPSILEKLPEYRG